MVYNAGRDLEPPIGSEDRRAYQLELSHLVAASTSETPLARSEKLGRLLHNSAPDLDADGRPILRIRKGEEVTSVGIAGSNILAKDPVEPITQQLLEARLREELRKGSSPKVSESDVTRDWDLLQKARNSGEPEAAEQPHRAPQGSSQVRAGNRP
jgi:hypothetical protein